MKGHVLLKNKQDTLRMVNECLEIVSNLKLEDMKKEEVISYKFSWRTFRFEKVVNEIYVKNFLLQKQEEVKDYLKDLVNMIMTGNEIYLSTTSYNELVKLSKGDININAYWLLYY